MLVQPLLPKILNLECSRDQFLDFSFFFIFIPLVFSLSLKLVFLVQDSLPNSSLLTTNSSFSFKYLINILKMKSRFFSHKNYSISCLPISLDQIVIFHLLKARNFDVKIYSSLSLTCYISSIRNPVAVDSKYMIISYVM